MEIFINIDLGAVFRRAVFIGSISVISELLTAVVVLSLVLRISTLKPTPAPVPANDTPKVLRFNKLSKLPLVFEIEALVVP